MPPGGNLVYSTCLLGRVPGQGRGMGAMTALALLCPLDPDSGSTGHLSRSRSLTSRFWGLRPQSGCAILGRGPLVPKTCQPAQPFSRTQLGKGRQVYHVSCCMLKTDQLPPISHRPVLSSLSRRWPGSPFGLAAHFPGAGGSLKGEVLVVLWGRRMGLYLSAWWFCLSLS